jgi:hypothetical protein
MDLIGTVSAVTGCDPRLFPFICMEYASDLASLDRLNPEFLNIKSKIAHLPEAFSVQFSQSAMGEVFLLDQSGII